MTKDEALKMCLEYIETDAHERKYVRHAIKEALAEQDSKDKEQAKTDSFVRQLDEALAQPEQEPVAWTDEHLQFLNFLYGAGEFDGVWFEQKHQTEKGAFWWRKHLRRLFDAPPQRKPLTDEEIYDMYNEPRSDAEMIAFARAIEAAHGIKGEA